MRHRFFIHARPLLAVVITALLTACQNTAPAAAPPHLSFTRYQPVYLDVGNIDIVQEYHSPMHAPNVEHLIPISPAEAMGIWVKDRLRAVGSDKSLQVIIKDASVVGTDLPTPGGVKGFFTDSQNRRYDAKLDVELRIYGNESAMSLANIEITVTRSMTMNESASVDERKAAFNRMIFNLMEAANAELEKNMFQYFGNYISYSHSP